ncbi:unnamed protein product, partial [Timema podura]|nr:unnamed protein product [Timema podura]
MATEAGLVFNKAADSCDYARNVICKIKGASKAEGGPSTKAPPITAATRGIEQLEKQLQAQEKNSAGAPGGISKSLYERVLSRNVNRNNNDRGPTVLSRSTTVSPDAST